MKKFLLILAIIATGAFNIVFLSQPAIGTYKTTYYKKVEIDCQRGGAVVTDNGESSSFYYYVLKDNKIYFRSSSYNFSLNRSSVFTLYEQSNYTNARVEYSSFLAYFIQFLFIILYIIEAFCFYQLFIKL